MNFRSRYILFILCNILSTIKSDYLDDYEISDYDDYIYTEPSIVDYPELPTINLTFMHIPILNDEIFEKYNHLTQIILSNNKIRLIDAHTFNKFNNSLEHLQLTSNNLITFNIEPISKLKELDLSNNSLTILNNTNFQKFNLEILDVSSNNLTEIFCLNVAKRINLSHNNISNICNFSESIVNINLSYNNITHIHNHTFSNCKELITLDVSHNQIVTIQYDTFPSRIDHLKFLNFSHNRFTELDLLQFKYLLKLKTLDLSHNNISIVRQYPKFKFKLAYSTQIRYIFLPSYTLSNVYYLYLEGNPIKEINVTNLCHILDNLEDISISFSEISCSLLQIYLSEINCHIHKGPVIHEENIHGIKCDSSLNTLKDSDIIDSILIVLNKVNAILIVLAFFFSVFVVMLTVVIVKSFRANIVNV